MRVIIADDSEIMRERLIAMLSAFEKIEIIGEAGTHSQAIKVIRSLKPDVVILDIRLPGGSGIDVLQTIKQDKFSPRIIIFTNYPYPQYRKKCIEAGAEFFFDKSTESQKMIKAIERLASEFSKSEYPEQEDVRRT